jgi:hypothetical protein
MAGVIEKLEPADVIRIVKTTPEQTVFDWKRDFHEPRDDDAKGEVVKDLMAVANGTAFTHRPGYVFYGVEPRRPDPIIGVTEHWDDAKLQQLAASVLDPVPNFVLYEVDGGAGRTVIVLHAMATMPFHVVKRDIGRLREGQSMIRQGSATRGVTQADQVRLYLTPEGGYVQQVLQQHGAAAQMTQATNERIRILQAEEQQLRRDMERMAGLPPGSLG